MSDHTTPFDNATKILTERINTVDAPVLVLLDQLDQEIAENCNTMEWENRKLLPELMTLSIYQTINNVTINPLDIYNRLANGNWTGGLNNNLVRLYQKKRPREYHLIKRYVYTQKNMIKKLDSVTEKKYHDTLRIFNDSIVLDDFETKLLAHEIRQDFYTALSKNETAIRDISNIDLMSVSEFNEFTKYAAWALNSQTSVRYPILKNALKNIHTNKGPINPHDETLASYLDGTITFEPLFYETVFSADDFTDTIGHEEIHLMQDYALTTLPPEMAVIKTKYRHLYHKAVPYAKRATEKEAHIIGPAMSKDFLYGLKQFLQRR